ncbi:hypothetical protein MBLNU459_g1952t1 [Dothideomycetes sp. NU459]
MTSKLEGFNRTDVTYKTVKDHTIETAILIPKSVAHPSGKRPLLVHFHGGFLIVGDKIFEPLIQLAESKGAIIVSPDYRLLPEATGSEILEDISSFWTWVHSSLAEELIKIDPTNSVDLSNILVAGEKRSAVISQYGMLDIQHPHLTQAYAKDWRGAPPTPNSVVDDHLATLGPAGAIRSSTAPTTDWGRFIAAVMRNGRYLGFLLGEKHDDDDDDDDDGTANARLFPMQSLTREAAVPPLWIVHGDDDAFVPLDVSGNFVKRMEALKPRVPLLFTVRPGDHGFDCDMTADEAWVKEGYAFIDKFWPLRGAAVSRPSV